MTTSFLISDIDCEENMAKEDVNEDQTLDNVHVDTLLKSRFLQCLLIYPLLIEYLIDLAPTIVYNTKRCDFKEA